MESAIVFCNQKFMTEELARRLKINGYDCEYIMGDLPQSKRLEIIDDLKAGKLVSYSYKQKQVDDYGDATFANDVISMKFTEEGKPSTDTENYDPATVVAPSVTVRIRPVW